MALTTWRATYIARDLYENGGSHDLLSAIRAWHIRMSDDRRAVRSAHCDNMPLVILEAIQMTDYSNTPLNFIYKYPLARFIRRRRVALYRALMTWMIDTRLDYSRFLAKTHHDVAERDMRQKGLWRED